MKLTIKDRIQLPSLYPDRGNMMQIQLSEDITNKIKISQEEMKDIGFQVVPEGGYKWAKENDIDVEFTELEINFLQTLVKEKDDKKEIDFSIGSLCKKLMDYKPKTDKKESEKKDK